MYVPHLPALLSNLGLSRAEFERAESVAVPRRLLAALLRAAAGGGSFNQRGYLLANPDIAAALRAGEIADAHGHYRDHGFLEGRLGGTPAVDESWYLGSYPDVAAAVRRGQVGSATEHFLVQGAAEGRAPNESTLADASAWRSAFGRGP